jgi:hypothetical protein
MVSYVVQVSSLSFFQTEIQAISATKDQLKIFLWLKQWELCVIQLTADKSLVWQVLNHILYPLYSKTILHKPTHIHIQFTKINI